MAKDNKTIAVTLRFWSSGLSIQRSDGRKNPGPKVCWDSGMAHLEANSEKGITAVRTPFQCYEDVVPAIKELFRKNGIVVASDNKRPRVLSHRRRSS